MPENNFNVDQAFAEFIDQMMLERNLLTGDQQQNQQLRAELSAQLDQAIQRSVLEALPDEKLAELSQMLDRGDISDDEIEKFFDDAGVDYTQAVARAIEDFRANYINTGMTTTNTNDNTQMAPAGSPVQGTTSEVPGASDVEGVEITTMTEEVQ